MITAALTALATFLIQERRLRRDFELDRDRLRTEFMAERVARKLLESEKWKKRSFLEIEKRLGGFEDNELRKILVRAGAVRFEGDNELWGLLSRNTDDL
jgi:hypothetical protein